jgi:hypothetical protein
LARFDTIRSQPVGLLDERDCPIRPHSLPLSLTRTPKSRDRQLHPVVSAISASMVEQSEPAWKRPQILLALHETIVLVWECTVYTSMASWSEYKKSFQ